MEVPSGTGDEVIVEVLLGRWSPGELLLHHGNQLSSDLTHFIPCKQVGDLSRGQHIVKILQEALIFHLIVCKDECDSHPLQTWSGRNKWLVSKRGCVFIAQKGKGQ